MNVNSSVSYSLPPNPQQLIHNERSKYENFPFKRIHEFLEGSPENSDAILRFYADLERDPVLSSKFYEYDASQAETRELTALRIERLSRYLEQEGTDSFFKRLSLITVYDPSTGIRISVNLGLFINCIKGNGTADQVNYWCYSKESVYIKQIYGCFGMTELGHGSNVAGCETTAVFDESTDEFIINTPHIGATKWWIGGAAHSATHSVVYARLIVKGKDYGVKTFIVPLRDTNHTLFPGVTVGEIGPKMGRQGVDNGWIQFSNVRIPRFFMLQKWCKVSRDGEVELPPLEQISYISLLGGRVAMAVDSYRISARFITIATRYAIGRKQFKVQGSKEETQLLDYPLHQRRLMPFLALTYVMAVGTSQLDTQHALCVENLDKAVSLNDPKLINECMADTKSLFIDSGSLKSTCTWLAATCIDQCRQACGGHGYSSYNGFGKAYDDWVVQCTWEGDNNVLGMSVGKTIITNLQGVLKGKKVTGSLGFLNGAVKYKDLDELILVKESDLDDFQNILTALEVLIIKTGLQAAKNVDQGWDAISYERVSLSKLRCHQYLLSVFLQKLKGSNGMNQFMTPILRTYCLVHILEEYATDFMNFNLIDKKLKAAISLKLIPKELAKLRNLAIPLTDAFLQPDNLLHSAIGQYNGDVYDNYFRVVKTENNVFDTKAPYTPALQGMLNRPPLAARQRRERSEATAKVLSK